MTRKFALTVEAVDDGGGLFKSQYFLTLHGAFTKQTIDDVAEDCIKEWVKNGSIVKRDCVIVSSLILLEE